MKFRLSRLSNIASAFVLLGALSLGTRVHAASATWTSTSSDTWTDPGAWNPGVPGSTTVGANRDIATFNTTTGVTVTIGPSSEYLGSIQFDGSGSGDNGNIGSFTFNNDGGSDSFGLYSPGSSGANKQNSIYILNTVNNASASATEVFNAPIILEASQGFDNDAASSNVILDIASNISASDIFLVNNRLYQMWFQVMKSAEDDDAISAFLSSFTLKN